MDENTALLKDNTDEVSNNIECPLTRQEPGLSWVFLMTHLHWLLFKPGAFFSEFNAKITTAAVLFATYLIGILTSYDRLDTLFEKALKKGDTSSIWVSAAESWSYYWVVILLTGFVTAAFSWVFWGWIFNLRIKWSGAVDVDTTHGRNVYMITNMVYSLPTIAFLLLVTLQFPDYQTYYFWPESYYPAFMVIVFSLWSFFTQYFTVVRLFDVIRWKAIVFFIALPVIFNVAVIALYIWAKT